MVAGAYYAYHRCKSQIEIETNDFIKETVRGAITTIDMTNNESTIYLTSSEKKKRIESTKKMDSNIIRVFV